MKKSNALQVFIKTAAVSGIALLWQGFTVGALKMARHIVSYSPDVKEKVMCEECHCYFFDDFDKKLLCEACRDDLVRDNLN